jgi:hypothetical protein
VIPAAAMRRITRGDATPEYEESTFVTWTTLSPRSTVATECPRISCVTRMANPQTTPIAMTVSRSIGARSCSAMPAIRLAEARCFAAKPPALPQEARKRLGVLR